MNIYTPNKTQNNKNKNEDEYGDENEKLYIRKTNNQLGEKDPL